MPPQEITSKPTASGDAVSAELTAFRRRFALATERSARLGQQLKETAQTLISAGQLPSDDVMAELMAVRAEIQQVCQQVVEKAKSLGISLDKLESLSSLASLQPILNAIVQMEQKHHEIEFARTAALTALNRVLCLTHRDDPQFAPLTDCQSQATTLGRSLSHMDWKQLPPETLALARGTHPFCTLMKLTEDATALDDEHWAQLLETVATSFSRPLALAAARGRLIAANPQMAGPPAVHTDAPQHEKTAARSTKDPQDNFRFERIALP